jgi:protein-disulfide isomerase
MSKQFLGVIAAIILVFAGIVAFSGSKGDGDSGKDTKAEPSKHIKGEGKANVTLVEYGDFQCPYCAQYYPVLKQVHEEYKDKIYFQFRNFPIISIHPNAFAASRAAEAADIQGKFWEMHDMLYENQSQWSESGKPVDVYSQFAKQLGLNVEKFKKDYASSKVNAAVNADVAAGNKLDITGTPTFYLDGKKVEINQSFEAFKKVLDAEIAKKAPKNKAEATPQQ